MTEKKEDSIRKFKEKYGLTGWHSNYSNELKAIALLDIAKQMKRFNDLFEKFIDKS